MARLTPDDITSARFGTARRGFAEGEVKELLRRAADALREADERADHLATALEAAQKTPPTQPPMADDPLDALGEETAAVLRSAREAASDLRRRAEESAARMISEAQEESARLRVDAEAVLEARTREADEAVVAMLRTAEVQAVEIRDEAERYAEEQRLRSDSVRDAEIETARNEARRMLDGAQSERLAIVDDLARRRGLLLAQIEELRRGRDGLIDAFRVVKRTFLEATDALARVEQRAATAAIAGAVGTDDDPAALPGEESEPTASAANDGGQTDAPFDGRAEEAAAGATSEQADTVIDVTGAPIDAADTGEQPALDHVDSLFARLRAAQEHPDENGSSGGTADAQHDAGSGAPTADETAMSSPEPSEEAALDPVGAAADPEETASPGAEIIDARDARLAELATSLLRRVKRAAQDEQNEILDAVRRHKKGPLTADEVLPGSDAHLAAWSEVVASGVDDAYAAGRAAVGGSPVAAPASLSTEAAAALAEPLRERLVAAVEAGGDDDGTSEVLDRIGARYREWKQQELDVSVAGALRNAFALGAYDAAAPDAVLRWINPADGCSADCHDNALEPTLRGETFPTGHAHPPSYAACRCLVVPQDVLAASLAPTA